MKFTNFLGFKSRFNFVSAAVCFNLPTNFTRTLQKFQSCRHRISWKCVNKTSGKKVENSKNFPQSLKIDVTLLMEASKSRKYKSRWLNKQNFSWLLSPPNKHKGISCSLCRRLNEFCNAIFFSCNVGTGKINEKEISVCYNFGLFHIFSSCPPNQFRNRWGEIPPLS